MRKLNVFNNVSIDGFFCDRDGDMSWAHNADPEWADFTQSNARGEVTMVFGRITYQQMASFWPTPTAKKLMPKVANAMNGARKVVFSKTLKTATWATTQLVHGSVAKTIRALKKTEPTDLLIMGSGTIVSALAEAGLIDSYQLVIHPIVLGRGRTLFEGVKQPVQLAMVESRSFKNGNVVVRYEPQ